MIEAPAANNRELAEVVFTAADLIPSSPESNRAKTAETLLNILEGRIRNSNTRLERESAHTPVFEQAEIKTFLETMKCDSLMHTRDKALFSLLLYSWARVSAIVALKVENYYERKGERWLRLNEKRGKIHEVPVHAKAREAVDRWLAASGLGSNLCAPLFPAFGKDKKTIQLRHMDRRSIWRLLQSRARANGLKKHVCCHSFRATAITEYMNAGGTLDIAQRIAGHSELSTTKIYDRSQDRVTIVEIERVCFEPSSEAT